MSEQRRLSIRKLATGVPGLDTVLGDGLPEYSFNLIAGEPGTGKTTLAHQIMFANATAERPVLYFTVLGEPTIKMLRYQQQMSFFDPTKVGSAVQFVNLSDEVLQNDLARVLDSIVREVEAANPGIVMVDSFRTATRGVSAIPTGEMEMQGFVQRLAVWLATWQATTFLVGEYAESEIGENPVFTVADGIIWLTQSVERNSSVRKLRVVKIRGQAPMPGLHTFRITHDGLQVFPRLPKPVDEKERVRRKERASTGVTGLDEMMGGGVPAGDSVLVAGPSGSGKTVLAAQFIAEGVRTGEPGVIAVFEEHPKDYLDRAKELGIDLEEMARQGKVKVIYLRPLDLSVDETLREIQDRVKEIGAKRVVIDSLSGFEIALAPTFREDFRESLYRLVGALTGVGITVLMTVEITESYTGLSFSPHAISFLTDDIVLQRYVEIESYLRKVITVAKMRGSEHSEALREYRVTSRGIVIGDTLTQYRGIITGVPQLREQERRAAYPGLTDQETRVLQALLGLKEASVEVVARTAGLRRQEATRAIDRLVALLYAAKSVEDGKTIYRPAVRPLGE